MGRVSSERRSTGNVKWIFWRIKERRFNLYSTKPSPVLFIGDSSPNDRDWSSSRSTADLDPDVISEKARVKVLPEVLAFQVKIDAGKRAGHS
jgi:hypothetical protein